MLTFAKILLGVDNSVMLRQLLQSDRAPFFGILMMTPLFQLSGIFLLSHMVLKSGCNMLAIVTVSALNSSSLRQSLPGALWFFRELMAAMIYSSASFARSSIYALLSVLIFLLTRLLVSV